MIYNFKDFIFEKLHVNEDVDSFANLIYKKINYKKVGKVSFNCKELVSKLKFSKLIINIIPINDKYLGFLNLDKCKKLKTGNWNIYITLTQDSDLKTLKHELNHAFRLTLRDKDSFISDNDKLQARNIFNEDDDISNFFKILYFANDEEIYSNIIEFSQYVKDMSNGSEIDKFKFKTIIENSEEYEIAKSLINFDCKINFKKFNDEEINNFFYLLDKEIERLKQLKKGFFNNLKLVFNNIKDFKNKPYKKPKKDAKYYTKWINSQGNKMLRKLYKTYDLYKNNL